VRSLNETNEIKQMKSSVIDIPRKKSEADLFGIQKYQNALVEFVNHSHTPLTIALQGEWGSGKTSLMNLLDDELCDKGTFYRVWINSWQYSLMRTPEEAILKIVEGMIEQILKTLSDNDGKNKTVENVKSIFKKISFAGGKFLAKQIADKAGLNPDGVDAFFDGGGAEGAEISRMKKEIEKLIAEIIETSKDKNKTGFIFFIDDLDRIDPPVAVQILELLKNIFDLDKCIFVLAIDYDVVIKGLEPKFGKLTPQNEREFRSFFDKIIQMPFSMPVASYTIDVYLIDALKNIGFITEEEATENQYKESLTELASLSVGQNPRALKRLTNTLSLITIINKYGDEQQNEIENEKLIGFAMVCLQIAYPYVYNKLIEDSNFINWNDETALKLDLESLTPEQQARLNSTSDFDEPWEKVLFRMCQKETYSKNRVFQISRLLNKVKELIPENRDLGEVVSAILEQSAITNLAANDKPKVIGISRKDNINLCISFSDQLVNKLKEKLIVSEAPPIKSTSNITICKIDIPIENAKFGGFKYRLDICQATWTGVYICLRAWDGNTIKNHGKNAILQNVRNTICKSGYDKGNGIWDVLSKTIKVGSSPLNFSKLDDASMATLADSKKLEALVNTVNDECKIMVELIKNTFEADK
jgi:hypothetical protein